MDNLNTGIVSRVRIPQPPMEEQQAIVDYIRSEANKIDSATDRARREIDLLREYRTRMITDVVTGKLDVRGVQLPPLDDIEAVKDWVTDEDIEAEETDEMEGVDA